MRDTHKIEIAKTDTLIDSAIKQQLWGDGPWLQEPDELEFKYRGYHCEIVRRIDKERCTPVLAFSGMNFGHLCGYVRLPLNHLACSKAYEEIDELLVKGDWSCVHGGITFKSEDKEGFSWVGFDCAHAGDLIPGWGLANRIWDHFAPTLGLPPFPKSILDIRDGDYRTVDYCIEQCCSLIDQLIEEENG